MKGPKTLFGLHSAILQVLLVIRFGSFPPDLSLSGILHLAIESASILVVFLPIALAVCMYAMAVRNYRRAVGHCGRSISLAVLGELLGVLR